MNGRGRSRTPSDFESFIEEGIQSLADSALHEGRPIADVVAFAIAKQRRSPLLRMGIALSAAVVAGILVVSVVRQLSIDPLLVPGDAQRLQPVSLGHPTSEERDVIAKCGVDQHSSQVIGMGLVQRAKDLPRFVRLTGAEPEIQTDKPAWAVAYGGQMSLATRGHAGSVFSDPICVVIDDDTFWFVPELPASPVESLPPLAP